MTEPAGRPRPRAGRARLLAASAPGLGRMLRHQLAAIDGIEVTGTGFDGHADLVFFEAEVASRAAVLRCALADEVLAEVGRASRAAHPSPAAVAGLAWEPGAVERALSVWAQEVRPLSAAMTFSVRAQVPAGARFSSADLRRALTSVVARDRPRWRSGGPGQPEIRLSEFHAGQYVAGLRLGGAQKAGAAGPAAPGDAEDRATLLLPSVTAAMLELAGRPARPGRTASAGGTASTLLDPCCGSGAILAAALAAGWSAEGGDVDPAAIEAAAGRAPGAHVELGDACGLLLPDESVGACVTRLPRRVSGERPEWVAEVMAELSRVTRTRGTVVVLAPELPRAAVPAALRLRKEVPIRLPGRPATIWAFRRA